MRRLALCVFILALASPNGAAKEETVATLKARVESAPPDERSELCVRVAQHQLRNADKLYNEGHIDEARTAIEDVAVYSEKARDAAVRTKKRLKNVEIDARKMSERLRDLKRTLAVEDQPPVEQTIRRLEDVRTALLREMFSNKKDKK
jgi:hypothetical protein